MWFKFLKSTEWEFSDENSTLPSLSDSCILYFISAHFCLMMPLLCKKLTLMWIDPWFKLWTLWGRQKLTFTQPLILRRTDPVAHKLKKTRTKEMKNTSVRLGRNIVNWKHPKITLGKNLVQEISKDLFEFFLRILNPDMITVGFLERSTWLAWNPLRTNNRNNEPQNKNICYTKLIPRVSLPLHAPPLPTPVKSTRDAQRRKTLGTTFLQHYDDK